MGNEIKMRQKPIPLMKAIYKYVLPEVHHQLDYWKRTAEQIPDPELRKQAIASITSKQFHCEGGGVYSLLSHPGHFNKVVQFIVAYQTISDYLDNLCDRSVSQDPQNFRHLHQSMVDAISGSITTDNYYEYQENQDDGGYLEGLVKACHDAAREWPTYAEYQPHMLTLCQFYCDLQVYKHIDLEKREDALLKWWSEHKDTFSQLEWYEFAAATGSTLGIFYYLGLSTYAQHTLEQDRQVFEAYFPYVQGLHILLDYLIDQQEDREEGDLNFCFYYPSERQKEQRMEWFVKRARDAVSKLPDSSFHLMMIEGLLGMYLADPKVKEQKDVIQISRKLLKRKKLSTWFFFFNTWWLHRKGKKV